MKKYFPLSCNVKDTTTLIANVIKYILIDIAGGFIVGIATKLIEIIPVIGTVVGWILGIAGYLVSAYAIIGIALAIIDYVKKQKS